MNGYPNSIQISEINSLFKIYDIIDSDRRQFYLNMILYCDSVFMNYQIKKIAANKKRS